MRDWQGKLIDALIRNDNESDKARLWYTHKKIKETMDHYKLIESNVRKKNLSLSPHLVVMVKDGYIERALMPEHMRNKFDPPGKQYLYRRTGKPYKAKIFGQKLAASNAKHNTCPDKIRLGYEIWANNKKLPRWFRLLMM